MQCRALRILLMNIGQNDTHNNIACSFYKIKIVFKIIFKGRYTKHIISIIIYDKSKLYHILHNGLY